MMATILVVDDERLICTMLSRILELEGFTVVTAASGQQALELVHARTSPIDLLICDVSLPEMDGPTLVGELLELQPRMAALFMSGCCEEDQLGRCRGFEFLCKPFSLLDLMEKVRSLVPTSASVV
jgi:two-component system cell cycle sensor histidine kinase/response regulator CckA